MLTDTEIRTINDASTFLHNTIVQAVGTDEKAVSRWWRKEDNEIVAPGGVHVATAHSPHEANLITVFNPFIVNHFVRLFTLVSAGSEVSTEIERLLVEVADEICYTYVNANKVI